MKLDRNSTHLWLTTILPFALGYFIATAFRSINAILAHPLMAEMSLNEMEIGLVTSAFVFTYSLSQLPIGVLLDSWGARKTQTIFFFIGGVGIIVFSLASNVGSLALGRGILGIGMAAGFVGAVKAISENVKKEKIPFYSGVILAAGGLGALLATTPSKLFEIHYGWRALCITLGILTFLIALLIYFVTPEKKSRKVEKNSLRDQINGLKNVYRSPFFWRVAPISIFAIGGFIAMQGMWLGLWLEHVVGLTPLQSSNYLFVIAAAMPLGMISGGLLSHLSAKLNVSLITIVVIGIGIHIVTQIFIVMNHFSTNYIVWFIYSFFAQIALINYAIVAQHFGVKLSGRALTAVNILIFFFAFLAQYLFGLIVHLWPKITGSTQLIDGYKIAFSGLIILECLALLWYIYYRRPDTQEFSK